MCDLGLKRPAKNGRFHGQLLEGPQAFRGIPGKALLHSGGVRVGLGGGQEQASGARQRRGRASGGGDCMVSRLAGLGQVSVRGRGGKMVPMLFQRLYGPMMFSRRTMNDLMSCLDVVCTTVPYPHSEHGAEV